MVSPTGFEALELAELRRSAVEDFAVEIPATANKKTVLAALLEGGVLWEHYVAQHPEVAPATAADPAAPGEAREPERNRGGVITSPVNAEVVSGAAVVETPNVVFPAPPVFNANDKILIKMHDRENPLYEVRGYRFTQENPYALVSPADADFIIEYEEGFRQARPSELTEFYR